MSTVVEKESYCRSVNVSLPKVLIDTIDKVQRDRGDPSRSETFRFLLNVALGKLSYLPEERKKAYNLL